MTEAPLCIFDVLCVSVLGREVKNSNSNLYRGHAFHDNLFGKTRVQLDGSSWNFILQNFLKICRQKSRFI